MKKIRKIAICLLLLASMIFALASCGIMIYSGKLPEGYTGGVYDGLNRKRYFARNEIRWVETYEEAMLAIEHLQAAGNKVDATLSTYENEHVDAKYLFVLSKVGGRKRLKKGQMWYDREGIKGTVRVDYMGFLDKITIEELEYSYYKNYRCLRFSDAEYDFDPDVDVDYLFSDSSPNKFRMVQNGKVKLHLSTFNIPAKDLVETAVNGFSTDFPKTVVLIDPEK